MKIKDPTTGQEMEVFTAAEVEAKSKEISEKAVEEFKAGNAVNVKEFEETKAKLVEAEELLKEAEKNGNPGQIERLRKERDDAKKLADESTKGLDKKFEDFRKEFVGDTKNELLTKLSKGDADVRKKLELEFDKYNPSDNTKKGIEERMSIASQIVLGRKPAPGFLDGRIGGGDAANYRPGEKKEYRPNEIAIGNVLGVTDKDREAYEKYKTDQARKKGII